MQSSGMVTKITGELVFRNNSKSNFVGDEESWCGAGVERAVQSIKAPFNIMLAKHHIG